MARSTTRIALILGATLLSSTAFAQQNGGGRGGDAGAGAGPGANGNDVIGFFHEDRQRQSANQRRPAPPCPNGNCSETSALRCDDGRLRPVVDRRGFVIHYACLPRGVR